MRSLIELADILVLLRAVDVTADVIIAISLLWPLPPRFVDTLLKPIDPLYLYTRQGRAS